MSQRYVALLDTGFPQTFIRRHVLDHMLGNGVYLIRAGGWNAPSSSGCRFGWARAPRGKCCLGWASAPHGKCCLGWVPFTSADYCDFRTHGPSMRIDDLCAPSGRFVARVSASVTTAATPAPTASSVPTVPIPSDRDCAEAVGTPPSQIPPPLGDTPPVPARLDTDGDAAELQFADSVARFSHDARTAGGTDVPHGNALHHPRPAVGPAG